MNLAPTGGATLQEKVQGYVKKGAWLGWLLDPVRKQVYGDQPFGPVEQLENPERVSYDPVLPGFVVYLREAC